MKRFTINDAGVGSYVVNPDLPPITLDLNTVFGFDKMSELAQRAISFAVGHVFRNATAGKMEDAKAAHEAVAERAKALVEGQWSAGREGGEGESRTSLLAQALAAVMSITPQEAAAFINSEIATAKEEKGIDPEGDAETLTKEQISDGRKIAAAVRKSIADDPAVALSLKKIKLERDQAALAATEKAVEGKTSRFTS